jgi:dTDP-4-amino-4,6-dideoxygalactose transaminase
MIPFSPPRIDGKTIEEVTKALLSGWITTGPRTKEFEKRLAAYCHIDHVLCVNSASAGLELALRWFGVGRGDEVILPAYTYAATANVVIHCGATPVFADCNKDDFNIDTEAVRKAITPRTKVIMPVDMGGFPCDYDSIHALINEKEIQNLFSPATETQRRLNRILILSDAAHSFGASYKGKKTGSLTDISVFSFHAVKNLTTAEGGALCLHLPADFDNEAVYRELCIKSLHGQTKDAFSKMQIGGWQYDIVEPGYKCNMTDIQAAIGLVELSRYDKDMLVKRKYIFDEYSKAFSEETWAEIPPYQTEDKISSHHVYMLRIKNITEEQRNAIIQAIFNKEVAVNVHFIPLPKMSYYQSRGYRMEDYPVAYAHFSREISLPVYYDLSEDDIRTVIQAVKSAVREVLHPTD